MASKFDIFRGKNIGVWVKVPTALFRHRDKLGLSSTELLVLLGVIGCFPRKQVPDATLAKYLGVSRQTVHRSMKSLAQKGFLSFIDNPGYARTISFEPMLDKLSEAIAARTKVEQLIAELPDVKGSAFASAEPLPDVEEDWGGDEHYEGEEDDDALLAAFFDKRMAQQQLPEVNKTTERFLALKERVSDLYPVWRLNRDIDLDEIVAVLYNESKDKDWPDEDGRFRWIETNAAKQLKKHAKSIGWDPMFFMRAMTTAYTKYTADSDKKGIEPMLMKEFTQKLMAGGFTEYMNESILHQSEQDSD
jgi:DNA-binding MarR family transcriptional regulator